MVPLVDDAAALGFGDRGAVDVAQLVGRPGAQAGRDAGEQDGGEVADRRVVVAVPGHQAVVLRGELGIDFAGLIRGGVKRFAYSGSPALVIDDWC